jgi:hypothetical protein
MKYRYRNIKNLFFHLNIGISDLMPYWKKCRTKRLKSRSLWLWQFKRKYAEPMWLAHGTERVKRVLKFTESIPIHVFCQSYFSAYTSNRNHYFRCMIWYSLCGPTLLAHQFKLLWTVFSWKNVRFEVLTGVVMKSSIFWDITPCSLLKVKRYFGGTCCELHGITSQKTELFSWLNV